MTSARDELRRLVEQLAEDQVSAALIEMQRLASAGAVSPWPPSWFGAIAAGRSDTSERVDEVLAEGFGR
jgi:adenosylmethionine-8-amino-7-oxononanoate aminotransferase